MKVLHIEDRFHPGMGYQINFFAKYHHPGYEFHILTSDSPRLWTASDASEDLRSVDESFEREYNVTIHRLPSALDRRSRQNLWLKGLTGAIRKVSPDILYVHTIESYTSLRILMNRRILRKYSLFFDTHALLNQFGEGMKSRLFQWIMKGLVGRRISRFKGKVFATVPENRMILEKMYGVPGDHILYSPIGTDLSIFSYNPGSRNSLRQEEEVDGQGTVLLYTGKMNYRKNPHLILEAVSLIEEKITSPLYLIFVGAADSEYRDRNMGMKFKSSHIGVKFIPAVPVSELYRWYSMADFAVFPSENTLSALDAQACRLPVIMQSDMTNRERLEKGGLTYEQGNMKDLSEKILTMIDNPEQRMRIGREGETFVRGAYDYRKIVSKMESDLGLTTDYE